MGLPVREGLPELVEVEEGYRLNLSVNCSLLLPSRWSNEVRLSFDEVSETSTADCKVFDLILLAEGDYLKVIELVFSITVAEELFHIRFVQDKLIEV